MPVYRVRPHSRAPYLTALREYADRSPGRYHVPGHKGGPGTDFELREALGAGALELDVPLITHGVDVGADYNPMEYAVDLAARAWGARRTWFLSNGVTQGNHAIALALAGVGREVIVQRNVHASTIDGLVLAGLRPTWVAPELNPDLGIAHCLTPEVLGITLTDSPDAVAVMVVSPTYYGAVADIRGLARVAHEWGVPLVADEAWGSHFPFHGALPESALSAGADLVLSGTHKLVGSLAQSAMLHMGHETHGGLDEQAIDRALTLVSSTSPSSLLLASLDAARRNAMLNGPSMVDESIAELARTRDRIREISGLEVLDESLRRHPGVYDYDPLRLAIDVRGTGASGYELAAAMREDSDVHLELRSESMLVMVFGLTEPATESCERLVSALSGAAKRVSRKVTRRSTKPIGPPPRWGSLAMTPREAFLGPQESVPFDAAAGRVAAESVAAYPPGIPHVFPGERLTRPTLRYIQRTYKQGGYVRGLSDRSMQTIRVVIEE